MSHVTNCIGPAKVCRVCAALMRLYFGDRGQGAGDESAPNDDIMSVWNLGHSGRVCTFVSSKQWGSPWELPTQNEYGIPGIIPMEEIAGMPATAFRKTICSYFGLFKQEMKKRGLSLYVSDGPPPLSASSYRGKNVWRLVLKPIQA